MKKYLFVLILMVIGISFPNKVIAQNNSTANNSAVNATKIKNLKQQKESLEKQISAEDKKRNKVIEGVAIETMEKRNEKQDSVCLELRSRLVDIELELKELGVDNENATSQIIQQYNTLIQNQPKDSLQITVPNKNK